jgi:hypothetical protein
MNKRERWDVLSVLDIARPSLCVNPVANRKSFKKNSRIVFTDAPQFYKLRN